MLTREQIMGFVIDAGSEYWPSGGELLRALPVPEVASEASIETMRVPLPEWGLSHIKNAPAYILVEQAFVAEGDAPQWQRCDWWSAAFSYMNGLAERKIEKVNGPGHSYTQKLPGFDPERFDRPWVNWIFLFLRNWVAHLDGRGEHEIFGSLPTPRIVLTHDVDALSKTLPLRIKQCAFNGVNAFRLAGRGRFGDALRSCIQAFRFAVLPGRYDQLKNLMDIEASRDVRSTFFFHGGAGLRRSMRKWLFDPGYDVSDTGVTGRISSLKAGGWLIGLHPGFETYNSVSGITAEREKLESAAGQDISRCRQHWLRFSWEQTWDAQERAGLKEDHTLGFNDRPGFRVSAALCFHPWSVAGQKQHDLQIVPFALMDSHLFLYGMMAQDARRRVIDTYIDEVAAVGGVAGVIWHQRVLHSDYGWGDEYKYLLRKMAESGVKGLPGPDVA